MLTDENSVKGFHIHLGFKRGSKFKDEVGEKYSIHDTQDKTWRHLNFSVIYLLAPLFSFSD